MVGKFLLYFFMGVVGRSSFMEVWMDGYYMAGRGEIIAPETVLAGLGGYHIPHLIYRSRNARPAPT